MINDDKETDIVLTLISILTFGAFVIPVIYKNDIPASEQSIAIIGLAALFGCGMIIGMHFRKSVTA